MRSRTHRAISAAVVTGIAGLSLLALPDVVVAQDLGAPPAVTVQGTVVDVASGAGLAQAGVTLGPGNPSTTTDSLGTFTLESVRRGTYTLTVRRFGYLDQQRTLVVTESLTSVRIPLSPAPLSLGEIIVTGGSTVRLEGTVVDSRTSQPLPYVSLRLSRDLARDVGTAASDTAGSFEMPDIPLGNYFLRPRLAGYHTVLLQITVSAPTEPVAVRLEPDTLIQAGMPLLTAELVRRRYGGIAAMHYGKDLTEHDRKNALEFVTRDTWVVPVPCDRGPGMCVLYRNRPVNPRLLVDDREICGTSALDYLAQYRPEDFFLIEVFGPAVIRAYTHDYADREATRLGSGQTRLYPVLSC